MLSYNNDAIHCWLENLSLGTIPPLPRNANYLCNDDNLRRLGVHGPLWVTASQAAPQPLTGFVCRTNLYMTIHKTHKVVERGVIKLWCRQTIKQCIKLLVVEQVQPGCFYRCRPQRNVVWNLSRWLQRDDVWHITPAATHVRLFRKKHIIFRVASKEDLHPTGLCSYVFPLHIILESSEIWQVYATRDNEDVQISRAAISKSSNRSDKSHRTTQYTYAVNQPKCELFTKYRDSKTCMHANF